MKKNPKPLTPEEQESIKEQTLKGIAGQTMRGIPLTKQEAYFADQVLQHLSYRIRHANPTRVARDFNFGAMLTQLHSVRDFVRDLHENQKEY